MVKTWNSVFATNGYALGIPQERITQFQNDATAAETILDKAKGGEGQVGYRQRNLFTKRKVNVNTEYSSRRIGNYPINFLVIYQWDNLFFEATK
jgi:hypothetical protein